MALKSKAKKKAERASEKSVEARKERRLCLTYDESTAISTAESTASEEMVVNEAEVSAGSHEEACFCEVTPTTSSSVSTSLEEDWQVLLLLILLKLIQSHL